MLPPRLLARLPWLLLAAAACLVGLGWLGIARAEELSGTDGGFLRRQIVWSALASLALVAAAVPNYQIIRRWTYLAYGLAIVLLIAVYFWPAINGSHRWMRLGGVGLQPSEFAKLAFVLALARYLMYRDNHRRLVGLLLPLWLTAIPVVLILKEPDLGTALVFLPVLFCMLAAAGARWRDLAKLGGVGLLLLPLLWVQMSREQKSRISGLLHQAPAGDRPREDGYHLYQSKQMLALGGPWGSLLQGEAVDDRAAIRLPESHSDFVFSVIGERLGLWGIAGLLLLYVIFVWRGLRIAETTREPFGRLVAVGVVSLFAIETLINTGMTIGLLPITGMSLPLVSYGGSGLLAHALAIGLLVNIAMRPGYELAREPFHFAADQKPNRRARIKADSNATSRMKVY